MRNPGSDHPDDFGLVSDYLESHSEAAFRVVYRRHTPALFGVALRLLDGDRTEAEEVVQETWLCAAQKLMAFRWESSLATWLTAIAINFARNRYRGRRVRDERELAEVTEVPAPAPVERTIAVVDLERAVNRLPDGYREVVVLHDVYGYTHDEIGDILGIAAGTSKSQLSRARSTLRRWLSPGGDENRERQTS